MGRRAFRLVLYLIIFIFASSLLGVGTTLRNDSFMHIQAPPGTPHLGKTCRLLDSRLVSVGDVGYAAVWKIDPVLSGGPDMAVISPFALRKTVSTARIDLHIYSNESSVSCDCFSVIHANALYPNVRPDLSGTCMLDQDVTRYLVHVGWMYGYSGDASIAIGVFMLVLFLLVVIIFMMDSGCCSCVRSTVVIPYRDPDRGGDFSGGEL